MGSEEALGQFRLKSERRKIRLRKSDQEKRLLELNRQQDQLWKQIRNLGYEPLIPPVQKGWKRIFVLRDDVKHSPRADFFQGLLTKINTVQYSDKKTFTVRRRRKGRKIRLPKEQKLRHFGEYEWQRSKLSEAEANCFTETVIWLAHDKRYEKRYVFNEPWRFVLKVMPNMITEVRVKDCLLEQQLDQISGYLERNHLEPQLQKLLHGHRRYGRNILGEKPKYKNPLANRPLREILTQSD